MIPILTFTANLVAETTYYVDDCRPGHTSRARNERFQVGGKGINVSKMLRRLKAPTTALCFPGGDLGPRCQTWLKANEIPFKAFTQDCKTRSGCIAWTDQNREISILGIDSYVSKSAIADCRQYLESITPPFVLAICGVVQDWNSPCWDALRSYITDRNEAIVLAIDTYGPSLPWFARQNPDVVKINREELETLFDHDTHQQSTESLLQTVSNNYNCGKWIITDGQKPIWHLEKGQTPQSFTPRSVDCISPIGSGDVFFATLLASLFKENPSDFTSAIQLAAEYASRNAASAGIADFDLD